jgi:poly(A) polymerase
MQGEQMLVHLLPEARNFGRLRILAFLETRGLVRPGLAVDPLRRLAALLPNGDRQAAAAVSDRLKLSNALAGRLTALTAPPARPDPAMDAPAARRLLHRIGATCFRDLVLLDWAERKASGMRTLSAESERWTGLLDQADAWQPVQMPVHGQDLIDLGVPRGPRIGAVLADMERWWEAGDYRAERAEALARLRTLV